MSSRVAVMRSGRIEQLGTPRELYEVPANDFVASFVGESTLLRAERAGTDAVRVGASVFRCGRRVPEGEHLALALHAEKLILDPTLAGHEWNQVQGRITDAIYQGESIKVSVMLDDGTPVSVRQHCHHRAMSALPGIGSPVMLSLHVNDTIVVPSAASRG